MTGIVTQSYRLEEQEDAWTKIEEQYDIIGNNNLIDSYAKEGIHTSAGCGLKLIMNKNFIVSAEAAKALNARDGNGLKMYIGFNYLF